MVSTRVCGTLSSGSNPDSHTNFNMQFYFDESEDPGFDLTKGSSKIFSVTIVALEKPFEKIKEIKKITGIKNLYKYNKLNRNEKVLVSKYIFDMVENYSLKIINKNENKDSKKLFIESVVNILKQSKHNKMKIFYEGEHLKKMFAKVSKKTNKKVSFLPSLDEENRCGVLIADLVAGSLRFK